MGKKNRHNLSERDGETNIRLNRRSFLKAISAGAASLAFPGCMSLSQQLAGKPNIVIALCDDLGYGDLGCYGHPHIKTPNLDRFATEGMKLTDCYAAAPVCSPARAGMLTGRTPHRCGSLTSKRR